MLCIANVRSKGRSRAQHTPTYRHIHVGNGLLVGFQKQTNYFRSEFPVGSDIKPTNCKKKIGGLTSGLGHKENLKP